jgi:hypothetical protein
MMRRYAAEAHLLDFDFYNDAFVWRYALAILTTRANLELFHH